jgi:8-oxo-dGTP diphosphatase
MTDSIPQGPAVGVGAIVFDGRGRVLLVRRGGPPKVGFWTVPGGRLEPGETLVECCRREALEETGLEVEPGPIVAVADRAAEGFHYVIVDFVAVLRSAEVPEPRPATDAADARWVDPEDLQAYPLVEGLAAVIHAARSSLKARAGSGLFKADGVGRLFLPSVLPGG